MVVCKFFQQGYCRYGQSCRFEHIYGSKYSYHANPPAPQQQHQPHQQQQQTSSVTDEQLVNQVQSDVLAALKGGMWILTCYAPFKEKAIIPGIHDLSPEETRLFIYEAKANNNIDNAVAYINNTLKETREKYEQLLKPTAAIIKLLRSLYQGEVTASPFTNTQNSGFGNPATSIFRSAVQNTQFQNATPSIFNQTNTGMHTSQPTEARDIFAQAANQNVFQSQPMFPAQEAAKSIFAQASQSVFNSNNSHSVFNTNQNQSASIFAAANQNIFSKENTQQNTPFQTPANVFQKSESQPSGFHQNVFSTNESGVYSKMEELTEQDLEAFNSPCFKLGFVPEIAPPRELCS